MIHAGGSIRDLSLRRAGTRCQSTLAETRRVDMKDQSSSAVQIHGRVVARRSGQALARMRVEAWDSELTDYQPLSETVTDATGKFELSLDGAFVRETSDDRNPEIFF